MKHKSLKNVGYSAEIKPFTYKTEWELVIQDDNTEIVSLSPDLWDFENRLPIKKDRLIIFKRIFWKVRNWLGYAPKIRGRSL